jgi:hypothetical protein
MKGREHSVDEDEGGWIILKRITNKYDVMGAWGLKLFGPLLLLVDFGKKKCLNFGFHEIRRI